MYLRSKDTYQAMQGAFETYLRINGYSLRFAVRDQLLAKAFFDQTSNEIHQKLSRGQYIPVHWSVEGEPFCLSLWKRIKSVMEEVKLDDFKLICLFAATIAEVFHELEPSMCSARFQSLLSMQLIPLEEDRFCHSASVYEHRLLKFFPFFGPRHSYTQSLFNDTYYVPSSSVKQFAYFDEETYQIVRQAYVMAIDNARSQSILSAEDVSILESELKTLRDKHRLLMIFQSDKRTVQYLVKQIMDRAESNSRFYEAPNYVDDDSSGPFWFEDINIQSDYRWYSAFQMMNIEVISDYSFEDYQSRLAGNHKMNCNEEDAVLFGSMFISKLNDYGRDNEYELKNCEEAYITGKGEFGYVLTLPEAIEQAYIETLSELRNSVITQLRLLSRKEASHPIYDFIPS
ncbi:hypothetical protein [Vibrio diazotrophicus]|uniref:hypothetical protein n=1 Tax=Vibrio diazotrophicus TaxID=685 RepID=UPI003D2F797B